MPARADWLWAGVLAAVAIGYAWAAHTYLTVLLIGFGDSWAHLALIRRTAELGLFPGDAFYQGMPTPPYYSLSHAVFAALSRLSGWPAHEMFIALAPVLAVVTVAAFCVWLHALTGDIRVAVIGAAVELLVRMPAPAWWALPYPREVALTPLALGLALYARGQPRRSLPLLVGAGAALGLCIDTHLFMGGIGLLSLLALDLALARRAWPTSRFLLSAAIAFAVGVPWINNFLRAWQARAEQTASLFGFAHEVWTLRVGSLELTLLQPGTILEALPWPLWVPALLGLLLVVARVMAGRATLADRYALWTTAGALALLLTPLYGLAKLAAGVWAPRLVRLIPLSLLIGLGMSGVFDWATNGSASLRAAPLRLTAAAALAGLAMFGAVYAVYQPIHDWGAGSAYLREHGPLEWQLAATLARSGPLPRVVLSDPDTSYLIPYHLGSSVVTMPAGHGSAYADHTSREQAARRIYAPDTPMPTLLAILDDYGVDAVAIDLRNPWPAPDAGPRLAARLRAQPAFTDTGCCGDLVVLRYASR